MSTYIPTLPYWYYNIVNVVVRAPEGQNVDHILKYYAVPVGIFYTR